ncbi:MAG: flotillin family protein [Vulcanimicrobiota bacterium]
MDSIKMVLGIGLVGFLGVGGLAFLVIVSRLRRFVEQGKALIVTSSGEEPEVFFTSSIVWPLRNRYEIMDISVHAIEIGRAGKEGLICKDNIRADIRVTFFVHVIKSAEAVRRVAQTVGVDRASDPAVVAKLFDAKFSDALKTVGKQMDFIELYTHREHFRDEIVKVIGENLSGFKLEDVNIDYLEQTPKASLDPNNILDAQGIKKITELTAKEQVSTNEATRDREKEIMQKDVTTAQQMGAMERDKADAQLRMRREIETMTARENAEIEKVKAEEHLRFEAARIAAEQELAINNVRKNQEVQLAELNTQRLMAIEKEKVEQDRALQQVQREREVQLASIAKERDLEEQRKLIQDVIRERIAVEKTVAEEEERIKTLRLLEEAKRQKEAAVLSAQADAEQDAVRAVKAAEASEAAARLKAKEKQTLAEAELGAADKVAQAKVRLSEGIMAEEAALGLAEIKVKEADAAAFEKRGMAEVRIKEAQAPAEQKLGLAKVEVQRAEAEAQANAIQLKLTAEATGIGEKAKAMAALNEASRAHEEFRLQMENQRLIAVESIKAQVTMAQYQSQAMGEAFKSAKFNIVGGDGAFMERIFNAASMGRTLDTFLEHSDFAGNISKSITNGGPQVLDNLGKAASTAATKLGQAASVIASKPAAVSPPIPKPPTPPQSSGT